MNKITYMLLVSMIYLFSSNSFTSSMKTMEETLDDAKKQFITMPGCTGIGLGHKYINGKSTRQPAITFFVEKKVSVAKIPVEYMIPRKLNGYDTDVIERTFNPVSIMGSSKTVKTNKKRCCFS